MPVPKFPDRPGMLRDPANPGKAPGRYDSPVRFQQIDAEGFVQAAANSPATMITNAIADRRIWVSFSVSPDVFRLGWGTTARGSRFR